MVLPVVSTEFPIASLQEALAASISTGSFIDTAYYLFSRRTAEGRVGHPLAVYASSRVLKAAADHFDAQLSGGFSTDDEIPVATADYGYESDSDLDEGEIVEHDFEEVASGSKGKGKAFQIDEANFDLTALSLREEAVRRGVKNSLFIPDVAAVTWHALVFFIYTGKIYFAPLRSNGLQAHRLACGEHNSAHPDFPSLCSPKSMYRLADMVGLPILKAFAEQEIHRQLSLECVTSELFSHFSATYPDILTAQLQFVYDSGRMAQIMQKIQRHVASVVSGQMPHAETVLSALLSTLSELLLSNPGHPAPPVVNFGSITDLSRVRNIACK
ncbi:uncharacterized protein PHACADRAFT_131778 [Phanerochaete carnosa HHB-10118-sp]|uniref:BTB domain-containing protein n=1 Tax=Phanerochaete carnosa (strain HHB-10118-sp) TaxID=650164 RepID=K5VSZ5_PHACS|nr:uncharacterized protein PHACADRAFT_131778 [Phanerochaete carnosa HHB-10118-sp]EKM49895.1 hypothetical protein PHACADRAFT_131778 [Phanerochaete carnosa HHB-10118-sp]